MISPSLRIGFFLLDILVRLRLYFFVVKEPSLLNLINLIFPLSPSQSTGPPANRIASDKVVFEFTIFLPEHKPYQ